ncbi:MAG: DUF120 domain-containing protein [Promethearchaeota archaeon]
MIVLGNLGALNSEISISTAQLGEFLNLSQQTASRRLSRFEGEGFIKRTFQGGQQQVIITDKGKEVLESAYNDLTLIWTKHQHQNETQITILGTLVTGFGEGEYYMSLEEYDKQFTEKLGWKPYPGTLNFKIQNPEDFHILSRLIELTADLIPGFEHNGRQLGAVYVFWKGVRIGTPQKKETVPGAILRPVRTHHTAIFEIISPEYLRKYFNLKDGTEIAVYIPI